jgi:hypothetical protein
MLLCLGCINAQVLEREKAAVNVINFPVGAVAVIEARGWTTHDSVPELMQKAAEAASKIGASRISCNVELPSTDPARIRGVVEVVEVAKTVAESTDIVTGLIKNLIAFPMTIRSAGMSDKSLVCTAFKD